VIILKPEISQPTSVVKIWRIVEVQDGDHMLRQLYKIITVVNRGPGWEPHGTPVASCTNNSTIATISKGNIADAVS